MRIMIVGALGMLGTDLMELLAPKHQLLGVDRAELDITNADLCRARVDEFHPAVIMNAAALTQVDYCESHEAEAFAINGEGAGNLAAAAAAAGSTLVHYSTDYVFDGTKPAPYQEDDIPSPSSVYGKSKLLGEELVRAHCPDHIILRTAWLFGRNGGNFIRTIVGAARGGQRLRVVNDQRGSPTYSHDLAESTWRIVEAGGRGTYHATNSGSCTWYELAVRAVEWAGIADASVTPVTTAEFPRPAPRPANSVLANVRLLREGIPPMRIWQEAVPEYIKYLCVAQNC